MTTVSFSLSGLTCQACVKLCTMKFQKIAGVRSVSISLASGRGTITSEKPVTLSQLNAVLAGTHYHAS